MHRKRSLKAIKRDLDAAFSLFIRRRDGNENGLGRCVTCNQWRLLQCGHFIPRQHLSVRWDERNAHGQCAADNNWRHGALTEYTLFMQKHYGQSIVDELLRLKRTTAKFSRSDLERKLEGYKRRLAELEV